MFTEGYDPLRCITRLLRNAAALYYADIKRNFIAIFRSKHNAEYHFNRPSQLQLLIAFDEQHHLRHC